MLVEYNTSLLSPCTSPPYGALMAHIPLVFLCLSLTLHSGFMMCFPRLFVAVRFVGKMGGGALHALFKSCDAVVVPSRNEPFGIVVLEAWSAAKPVVATNSGGPRDFVNPNVTGVLVVSIRSTCLAKSSQYSKTDGNRDRHVHTSRYRQSHGVRPRLFLGRQI